MGDGARHFMGFGVDLISPKPQFDGIRGGQGDIGCGAGNGHHEYKNHQSPELQISRHNLTCPPHEDFPLSFGVYDAQILAQT